VTCISPSTQGYAWYYPITVSSFVVSTTPPPTDPGSGGSSGSGESGGSSGTLPDTGSDDAGSALGASLATAFIALGTVLAVRRRRAA
jgi:LPXTG-motif cell wall-anchored protein